MFTPISLYDKDLEGKSKEYKINLNFGIPNKDSYYTSITKKGNW